MCMSPHMKIVLHAYIFIEFIQRQKQNICIVLYFTFQKCKTIDLIHILVYDEH